MIEDMYLSCWNCCKSVRFVNIARWTFNGHCITYSNPWNKGKKMPEEFTKESTKAKHSIRAKRTGLGKTKTPEQIEKLKQYKGEKHHMYGKSRDPKLMERVHLHRMVTGTAIVICERTWCNKPASDKNILESKERFIDYLERGYYQVVGNAETVIVTIDGTVRYSHNIHGDMKQWLMGVINTRTETNDFS